MAVPPVLRADACDAVTDSRRKSKRPANPVRCRGGTKVCARGYRVRPGGFGARRGCGGQAATVCGEGRARRNRPAGEPWPPDARGRRALPRHREPDDPPRGKAPRRTGGAAPLAAAAGGGDRTRADGAARARGLLTARGERRLVRPPRRAGVADGRDRRRRRRLPLLPRPGLRVPPARELRRAQRRRREQEPRDHGAAGERTARARRPRDERHGLGVLLQLLGRPRPVALRVRAGGRCPGARPRRHDRHCRRGCAAGGCARRLPLPPGPPRRANPLRLVDPSVRLRPRRRAQRPAPVGDLPGGLRQDDRQRRRRRSRGGPQDRRGPGAAELQHRLLVVLRPPSRRLGRPLPGLRRAASGDPRPPRRPLHCGGSRVRGLPDAAAAIPTRQRRGRGGHLLGLEAVLDQHLRPRRRAPLLGGRRLAHRRLVAAVAPRHLPGHDPRHRLGREQLRGRCAPDRARGPAAAPEEAQGRSARSPRHGRPPRCRRSSSARASTSRSRRASRPRLGSAASG